MSEKSLSRKITAELKITETTLSKQLENLYKKISLEIGNGLPLESVKAKYQKQIKSLIAESVQKSWLYSHTIISQVSGESISITAKDGHGIETTINKVENEFWSLTTKLVLRNEVEAFKVNTNSEIEQLDSFDIHAAFIAFGIFGAYYAFNQGIDSKSQEIGRVIKLKFVVREDCVDTKICLPLNGGLYDPGNIPFTFPLHKHCHCRLIPVLSS